MSRSYVIGVTGGIATGKTTVLAMLGQRGAALIDADAVYHDLIAPRLPLWQELRTQFGPSIIAADETIDRKALGAIVFNDPRALNDLERLTHPAIVRDIERRIAQLSSAVVAIDAVKLSESGLARSCDQIWLVTCDRERQRDRLMARNNLSPLEADLRLAAQPVTSEQAKIATLVIDNSGTLASTRKHVARAWEAIPALAT